MRALVGGPAWWRLLLVATPILLAQAALVIDKTADDTSSRPRTSTP